MGTGNSPRNDHPHDDLRTPPGRVIAVRISRDYWVRQGILAFICGLIALPMLFLGAKHQPVLILVGLAPLCAWLTVSIWTYRRGPARIDAEGIVRRDGVSLRWTDLEKLDLVYSPRRFGGPPALSHYVVRFKSASVSVFPLVIGNSAEVLTAIKTAEAERLWNARA